MRYRTKNSIALLSALIGTLTIKESDHPQTAQKLIKNILYNPLSKAICKNKYKYSRHRKGKIRVTGWHKATILAVGREAVEVAELKNPPALDGGLFC